MRIDVRKIVIPIAMLTILFTMSDSAHGLNIQAFDPNDVAESDIDVIKYGIREVGEKIEAWLCTRSAISTNPPPNATVEYSFTGISIKKDQRENKYIFTCTIKFITRLVYENGSLVPKTYVEAMLKTESSFSRLNPQDYSISGNTLTFYLSKDINAIRAGLTQIAVYTVKTLKEAYYYDSAVHNMAQDQHAPTDTLENELFIFEIIAILSIVAVILVIIVYFIMKRKKY